MPMAELPFTDFLQRAKAPTRRTGCDANTRLRQIQTPLSQCPNEVKHPAKQQYDREHHAEKHFGGKHFADKIKLKNEKDCQRREKPFAKLFVLKQPA
jgi:hypothetical protein